MPPPSLHLFKFTLSPPKFGLFYTFLYNDFKFSQLLFKLMFQVNVQVNAVQPNHSIDTQQRHVLISRTYYYFYISFDITDVHSLIFSLCWFLDNNYMLSVTFTHTSWLFIDFLSFTSFQHPTMSMLIQELLQLYTGIMIFYDALFRLAAFAKSLFKAFLL